MSRRRQAIFCGSADRAKKTLDSVIFTPDVCAGAQTSCDRIGETRFGISPRAAVLANGMVERVIAVQGYGMEEQL